MLKRKILRLTISALRSGSSRTDFMVVGAHLKIINNHDKGSFCTVVKFCGSIILVIHLMPSLFPQQDRLLDSILKSPNWLLSFHSFFLVTVLWTIFQVFIYFLSYYHRLLGSSLGEVPFLWHTDYRENSHNFKTPQGDISFFLRVYFSFASGKFVLPLDGIWSVVIEETLFSPYSSFCNLKEEEKKMNWSWRLLKGVGFS